MREVRFTMGPGSSPRVVRVHHAITTSYQLVGLLHAIERTVQAAQQSLSGLGFGIVAILLIVPLNRASYRGSSADVAQGAQGFQGLLVEQGGPGG